VTDTGIIRMRRLLIKHALELRDRGTTPPGVDRPELYRIQSVCAVLPNGVNGIEATLDRQWKLLSEPPALTSVAG
jgi:phthalate 4,5-dioxygenase